MLKRLIYLSSVEGQMGSDDIAKILEVARRNNARADITGLLLFHDGCFFQALEGPAEAVDRIFAAIEQDSRHVGVIVLERRTTTERAFASWSMGFIGASKLSTAQRGALIDLASLIDRDGPAGFSPSPTVTGHIESFLNSFREFVPV